MSSFFASLLIVFNRFLGLIMTPYQTMRKIGLDRDFGQLGIIFFLVFLYYFATEPIRYFLFLLNFSLTVLFFYVMGRISRRDIKPEGAILLFSYTLFPTLLWFAVTSTLYHVLPPPRTFTLLGGAFSILYIAFSISLLAWKIILLYLAARFTIRQGFYRVMYTIVLYGACVTAVTYVAYGLGWAKVPFI